MPAIKHYLLINSSPENVYTALTTKKGIQNWWTTQTKIGKKVGEVNIFNFGDRYHNEMKITDLQPNKKVEWECFIGDKEWIETRLIFSLEKKDDSTILRFTHAGWKEETDFFASCNFQWGHYMKSLKDYCESGQGSPFRQH